MNINVKSVERFLCRNLSAEEEDYINKPQETLEILTKLKRLNEISAVRNINVKALVGNTKRQVLEESAMEKFRRDERYNFLEKLFQDYLKNDNESKRVKNLILSLDDDDLVKYIEGTLWSKA